MNTVWSGATLVMTVAEAAVVAAEGELEGELAGPVELVAEFDALPLKLGTFASVPDSHTDQ